MHHWSVCILKVNNLKYEKLVTSHALVCNYCYVCSIVTSVVFILSLDAPDIYINYYLICHNPTIKNKDENI